MEPNQQSGPESIEMTAGAVSSFRGLVEIFYQPAAWFEKLRYNPKILVPYIVLAVLTVGMFLALGDLLVEMQMQSPQFQEQLERGSISPDIVSIMWISAVTLGSITMLLAPLVAALLALFWGNVVLAGKASFKSLLSVMLYGEIIWAVGNLLIVPLALAKKSLAVGFNLGVLVAERGLQDVLYTALSKVDLFIIWEIVAIGIGLSIVYRLPRNKGYLLSVLSVGLLSVLAVAGAAIGSLF